MAMGDYPEETNILAHMPAFPVEVACQRIKQLPEGQKVDMSYEGPMKPRAKQVLSGLREITDVFFNYGQVPPYCARW